MMGSALICRRRGDESFGPALLTSCPTTKNQGTTIMWLGLTAGAVCLSCQAAAKPPGASHRQKIASCRQRGIAPGFNLFHNDNECDNADAGDAAGRAAATAMRGRAPHRDRRRRCGAAQDAWHLRRPPAGGRPDRRPARGPRFRLALGAVRLAGLAGLAGSLHAGPLRDAGSARA